MDSARSGDGHSDGGISPSRSTRSGRGRSPAGHASGGGGTAPAQSPDSHAASVLALLEPNLSQPLLPAVPNAARDATIAVAVAAAEPAPVSSPTGALGKMKGLKAWTAKVW